MKDYIDDVIKVIKQYRPSTKISSTHDLCYIADELKQMLVENSFNVSYLGDVEDSDNYVAIQTRVVLDNQVKTSFTITSNSSTTVTNSAMLGAELYSKLNNRRLTVTNRFVASNKINEEGFNPFNIIVRANDVFDFKIQNSNIIALRARGINGTNMDECFMGNKKLRVATLEDVKSESAIRTFKDCENLTYFEADLSTCKDLTSMFENCKNLQRIKIKLANNKNNEVVLTDMFKNCSSLELLHIEIDGNGRMADLDLSDTIVTMTAIFGIINSLPVIKVDSIELNYVKIYVPFDFSQAQNDNFKARGYELVSKSSTVNALGNVLEED